MTQLFVARLSPRQMGKGRARGNLIPPDAANEPGGDYRDFFDAFTGDQSAKIAVLEFGQPPSPRPASGDVFIGIIGSDDPGGATNEKGLYALGVIKEVLSETGEGNKARVSLLVDFKSKLKKPIGVKDLLRSKYLGSSGLRDNKMFGFESPPQAQNFVRAFNADVDVAKKLPAVKHLLEEQGLDCSILAQAFQGIDWDAPLDGGAGGGASPFRDSLIVSLAAKPFVIIAGGTGTGKTRAAREIAHQIAGEDNVATIAVGADWTDNRPLLGFRNLLSQQGQSQYVAPEALRLILRASAAQDASHILPKEDVNVVEPYFIILDEMNLSHVERYFADFLSSMESGEPLRLHDCPEGLKADGVVGVVPHQVKWPKNLFLIGTVNVDETTYLFSPKVLDRAHVIEFRVSWDEVCSGLSSFSLPNHERWDADSVQAFVDVSLSEYKTLSASDHAKLLEVLGSVHSVLSGGRFVFAHRTARECLNFVASAHALAAEGLIGPVDIIDLIDSALMQKVLPKLNGTTVSLGKVIDGLINVTRAQGLLRCADKLETMSRQLKADQFVSFIQ